MTSKPTIDCHDIATWLADFSGISTGIIGHHTLQRAVGERLEVTGLDDATAYLELLLSSPQEQQNLVELVVVLVGSIQEVEEAELEQLEETPHLELVVSVELV